MWWRMMAFWLFIMAFPPPSADRCVWEAAIEHICPVHTTSQWMRSNKASINVQNCLQNLDVGIHTWNKEVYFTHPECAEDLSLMMWFKNISGVWIKQLSCCLSIVFIIGKAASFYGDWLSPSPSPLISSPPLRCLILSPDLPFMRQWGTCWAAKIRAPCPFTRRSCWERLEVWKHAHKHPNCVNHPQTFSNSANRVHWRLCWNTSRHGERQVSSSAVSHRRTNSSCDHNRKNANAFLFVSRMQNDMKMPPEMRRKWAF